MNWRAYPAMCDTLEAHALFLCALIAHNSISIRKEGWPWGRVLLLCRRLSFAVEPTELFREIRLLGDGEPRAPEKGGQPASVSEFVTAWGALFAVCGMPGRVGVAIRASRGCAHAWLVLEGGRYPGIARRVADGHHVTVMSLPVLAVPEVWQGRAIAVDPCASAGMSKPPPDFYSAADVVVEWVPPLV